MNMFEQATRDKLRFVLGSSTLYVEDLWDLPLINKSHSNNYDLENLARNLHSDSKKNSEKSFVLKKTSVNNIIELKFNIVKHIIAVKLEENEKTLIRAKNNSKREEIMGILNEKESDALKSQSRKQLNKLLNDLID